MFVRCSFKKYNNNNAQGGQSRGRNPNVDSDSAAHVVEGDPHQQLPTQSTHFCFIFVVNLFNFIVPWLVGLRRGENVLYMCCYGVKLERFISKNIMLKIANEYSECSRNLVSNT